MGVGGAAPTSLYLEVEGLNGLPILIVGEGAKECPFLLQVFIEALQRSMQGWEESGRATSHMPCSHCSLGQPDSRTAVPNVQPSPWFSSFKRTNPFTARATSV